MSLRAAAISGRIVFAAVLAVFVYGFSSHHLFSQQVWSPHGRRRLFGFAIASAIIAVFIYVWRRAWLVRVPAVILGLYAIPTVGIAGPAAALFFLFSAWLLGRALLRRSEQSLGDLDDELLAALAGVCVYAAFTGAAVFFRINYSVVYFALFMGPIVWRRREMRKCSGAVLSLFGPRRWPSAGVYAAAALLTFVLCAQWLMLLKPEASADGLAVHLVAPAWVAAHHRWDFDFRRLIWAVLPMNGDWAYTDAYMIGGEHAARMLNFGIFGIIAALLFAVVRRWTSTVIALLLVAAFASSPLTQLETGSLFIDNLWSAMLFGAVVALVRARKTGNDEPLVLAGLFLGSAMATKPGTAAYFLPVAALAILEFVRRARNRELRPRVVLLFGACLLALALPPYVNAWVRTGNPVYPYLNTIFHSPYFDQTEPLREVRFHEPLSWGTLFAVTFASHNFFEGQDGGFAFQYLLLLPFCALYMRRDWPFAAWAGLAVALFGFIATFARDANLRYIYPTLPLLLLPAAAAMARIGDILLRRAVWGALAAAILLNTSFLAASGWYHKDFYLNALFDKRDIERYMQESCAPRRLVEYLNLTAPDAPVGFLASEQIAGLRGAAWTNSWHSPVFEREIEAAVSPSDLLKAASAHGIEFFVAATPSNHFDKMPKLVWAFLGEYTRPEYSFGDYFVARLKVPATTDSLLQPGDSRVRYSPDDWIPNPAESTMVASRPGAQFRLDFSGQQVTFKFITGPDHGQAEVTIDGQPRGVIEQYFPSPRQESITYKQHASGAHTLMVRLLATSHYASQGHLFDVGPLSVR